MRVHYSGEPFPHEQTYAIFLMGDAVGTLSWRAEAVRILDDLAFTGDVFVPEPCAGTRVTEADRIAWQETALSRADCILMWLPKNVSASSSDAWGYWRSRDPARLIVGMQATGATLEANCREVAAEHGELRRGGECQVPLHIWRTASFQAWYAAQTKAGNVLHGARVEWVFRIQPTIVFYWALRVDIEVSAEGRHKTNEVILGRPDIAAVVLYRRGQDLLDTDVVLVREFRSTSRTPDGQIWELPSGSTLTESVPTERTAVTEVEEELGLVIDPTRLRRHAPRQLTGTLSVHQAHVFSLELTPEQLSSLRVQEQANTTHGARKETEITAIRVRKLRDILAEPFVDWATVGMICAVLCPSEPEA